MLVMLSAAGRGFLIPSLTGSLGACTDFPAPGAAGPNTEDRSHE